ncbi:PAS domain S-box-containing protein [Chryseolinea serpens]|uniref:histidine kinase n=1 Tax=Chryseolinea serpens TaxID=947013 RepID=A0A1M5P498_9BACT|nr:PAS domain-containing sensor histidine kinase [Chryseolinea serpens]SHG96527.1 PAS domain S-box-containing protein [Chryseolinea serpens]
MNSTNELHWKALDEVDEYAILMLDKEGLVKKWNKGAEKLKGYRAEEVLQKSFSMFYTVEDQVAGIPENLLRQAANKGKVEHNGWHVGKNGRMFWTSEVITASRDDDNGLTGFIQISRHREGNRDFLANMSHELRTPLNAILGFSELLIDQKIGPLNTRQRQYLQDIHESGSHLLQLINNVLDLAKIESGKTELSVEIFSLNEVIAGVITTLESIATEKDVTIRLELSKALSFVCLDKNKFRQVLYNLLSNAIKFNREGGEVQISTLPHQADTFMVRVSDTGLGIPKEDLKKLFMPFVQLDSGTARQHEGSGLGLTLTKNIVELHRGQIGVDSEPGAGSTFWIIMPLRIT